MLLESASQLAAFLEKNTFTWGDPLGSRPDTVELDAENPDFYGLLDEVGKVFSQYRGEIRPSLHITLLNVEKANVPLERVTKLWRTIIENEYYFGNYDFQLFAKGEEGRCVNIGRLLSA
jgi:hypothetical protein